MATVAPVAPSAVGLPAKPPAPTPIPRDGAFREKGTVRHASLHALRYRIQGTAKITGEIDVAELLVEGILSVGGPVTADRIVSRGTFEAAQSVSVAGSFESNGTARLGSSFRAQLARTGGVFHIAQGVSVETLLTTRGALEVGGDVSVGAFLPDGRFEIAGGLRAKEISGQFDGASHVDRIEATQITLRPRQLVRLPVDVPVLRPKSTLVVDRIEADAVALEGVTVHYLKAEQITLGRHCHVTQLEGTVLRRDPSSHIGYESRSPPPYGLSR